MKLRELMDTIRFVREHFDMTILLIEHDMKLVGGICEKLTSPELWSGSGSGRDCFSVLKDPAGYHCISGRIGGTNQWQCWK